MAIIIFLIILAALVFFHELGHFLVAKLFGIRVDEFALGFPPQIASKKIGETVYALNLIPFGGYVKIYGEDPDEENMSGDDSKRSLVNKSKWIQAAVLVAGIVFNLIFAWVLLSLSLGLGLAADRSDIPQKYVHDARIVIVDVSKGSPAEKAGLLTGEAIQSLSSVKGTISGGDVTITGIQNFIADNGTAPITITYTLENQIHTAVVTPANGIVPGKPAIGIAMDLLGTTQVPWYLAPIQGLTITWHVIEDTASGLFTFFKSIFIGQANFSEVSGPVGLVGMVGEASRFGFSYLLGFTALISVNLALINIIPFPALDGGRLLFILIEAIKGSPIKPKIQNTINLIGFSLLILLMIVITYKDIAKLF